jgi:hypothetical protein
MSVTVLSSASNISVSSLVGSDYIVPEGVIRDHDFTVLFLLNDASVSLTVEGGLYAGSTAVLVTGDDVQVTVGETGVVRDLADAAQPVNAGVAGPNAANTRVINHGEILGNNGLILGDNALVVNTGRIDGAGRGIDIAGGLAEVYNDGTVSGRSIGIFLQDPVM